MILALVAGGAVLTASARAEAQAPSSGAPRPFIGVRFDGDGPGGARIAAVLPGSPAEAAGLRPGDGFVEIAGHPVSGARDVTAAIAASNVGDSVPLVVIRSGSRRTFSVVIGSMPGQVLQSFVGRTAPPLSLPRIDGNGRVDLGALRGRVVLVYFWSIHCGACRLATPDILRMHRAFEARGLSIVGISDDPIDDLRAAASTLSLGFPLVHDSDAKVGTTYWVSGIPAFFLVDRAGNVAYASEGWDLGASAEMERQVVRLIGQSRP
jgi:peroxiredoxin